MGERKRGGTGEPENLYERNGIFYARVKINNRELRRSLKTGNRREAKRRLAAWLKEISPYHGTIRATFNEAAELWIRAGQWKPKTMVTYTERLATLQDEFGELFWDQVDKPALLAFADKRRKKGNTPATINRYLTVISGIAKHVRELPGWPDHNPVEALPRKPRSEKRHRYVRPPAADIEAMFARMKGSFGDLCRVALETGARRDELVFLRWTDVSETKASFTDTKNRTPRVISIAPHVWDIISRQPRISEYVFVTRNLTPHKGVSSMWAEVRDRARIVAQREGKRLTTLRFHDLRHEYAIRYLENGGSLYTLKRLLGHGSVRQTEAYLDYLTPEQAAHAMKGEAQNTAHL